MREKDVKATFIMKREQALDILRQQANTVLTEYKATCEDATTPREKTVVVLTDISCPSLEVLRESFEGLGKETSIATSEFSLFEEIGKNSIFCIIVDPSIIINHRATIKTLSQCKVNIFVIYRDIFPKMDLWKKEFGELFSWPADIGLLVSKVKACG